MLEIAELVSLCKDSLDVAREQLKGSKAATRLGFDVENCRELVTESVEELNALRHALGH